MQMPPEPVPARPQLHDGNAVASLVFGLLWLGGLGSILAMVFGQRSVKQAKQLGYNTSGMAVAGLILGILGFIALVIVIIVAAAHGAQQAGSG